MAKRSPEQLSALHFNGRERRKSPRVRYDVDTQVAVAGMRVEVHLIDLSQSGCSFSSESWQPDVGQVFEIELCLPEQAGLLLGRVKVCSRLQLKSGIEFLQVDAAGLSRLGEMLSRNEGCTCPPGFFSG
ncbi:MAG: PilZ domain-containing protein [Pseudomonadales bacterium]|nr:PilZ domain-containing protein [Pseudomonadales bacterium]